MAGVGVSTYSTWNMWAVHAPSPSALGGSALAYAVCHWGHPFIGQYCRTQTDADEEGFWVLSSEIRNSDVCYSCSEKKARQAEPQRDEPNTKQ